MKSRYGWLSLLCLALLIACQSTPHNPLTLPLTTTDQPAWQLWLSSSTPNAVLSLAVQEDHLWVGTHFGLWQIDTATRRILRHDLQLGEVSQLLPIENGQMWVLGSGGLFFFDGQAWRRIELPDRIKRYSGDGGVYIMAVDATGDLWLVSGAWRGVSVFRYHGHIPSGTEMSLNTDRTNAPDLHDPDCQEVSVYAAGYKLVYQSSEECRALKARPAAFQERYNSRYTAPDPRGGVWVATVQGVAYIDGSERQEVILTTKAYTLDYGPQELAIDPQGRVWMLSTTHQLAWLQLDQSPQFQQRAANGVRALTAAREGGIWITHGYDLQRVEPDGTPSTPPPPQSDIAVLKSDRAGHVWAVDPSGGILEYNPSTQHWQQHLPEQVCDRLSIGADNTVIALCQDDRLFAHATDAAGWKMIAQLDRTFGSTPIFVADNHGGVWAGMSETNQISHYGSDSTRFGVSLLPDYKPISYSATETYNNLFIDRQDNLWVSTPFETMRYDGSTWQRVDMPPIGEVKDLISAPDGRLWFMSEYGIAMYDPRRDTTP